ncbi:Ig-like domain-containing protein [Miltoncostaea marina]|uniref:Ig-like domain-containing protein n=1 Tax=Miltoncostaea marina TaxID=2843215 RepID=UPI001C3E7F0B|nr:Ig-like domain-containing protein [Miltoncostaea marina]
MATGCFWRGVVMAGVLLAIVAATAVGAPRGGHMIDPPDGSGAGNPDARSVAVSYDPDSASLSISLGFYEPFPIVLAPGASQEIFLDLSVGGTGSDGRSCVAPDAAGAGGRAGDLRIDLWAASSGGMHYSAGVRVSGSERTIASHGQGAISGDRRTITWFIPADDALLGRDYRCVTSITFGSFLEWFPANEIAPFWFDGYAPPSVADRAAPTVSWQSPVDGQVISGVWQEAGVAGRHACRVGASDDVGVTRVEFLLDGEFLNEERYAPWACVVDTRTLSNGPHTLRAIAHDAAGRSGSSQITVVVDNDPAAPPLPDPPAPPRPPAPGPLAHIGPPAPPAPGAQPSVPATPVGVAGLDRRPPRASLWRPSRSLRALVGGGMVVPFACDEACTGRARLLIAPSLARRLGLSRLIGSSKPSQGAAGGRALAWVRLSPAARRTLRGRRALRATLAVTVADPAGNRRVLRRALVLR